MPAAPTFTSTWPGPGSGWGTSWYSGVVFHATMRYAFIRDPFRSAPALGSFFSPVSLGAVYFARIAWHRCR